MRIYNIDFLRGLAVSMVLIVHSSSSTLPRVEESAIHELFEIGKYGVQIFFVISGYIICYSLFNSNYSIKNLLQFFTKRLVRINPPAYILIIGFLLIELFTWLVSTNYLILPDPFDSELILANFLFLSNAFGTDLYIDTFWTLEIELQFYLLIGIMFPFLVNKSIVVRFIALGGIILFGFSAIPVALTGYVACFLLGISYFLMQFHFINRWVLLMSCIVVAALFLFHNQYFELFFSFLSLFLISLKKPIKSEFFQYLGRISYSLYIVHVFIFIYLDAFLNKLDLYYFHDNLPTKAILIIGYIGIAILVSAIFYKYIEKPFINYSKKISWN
ncbi:MAG: acyltransferase [Crocinitomicaceae bacterium]|nr:acyltransferase [Crocinitomicaceae bacterium]